MIIKHPQYLIVFLTICGLCLKGFSQSNPGSDNLIHQWTFDDGTANDNIRSNPVDGQLAGGATIVNKTLKLTSQGQYLSFTGSQLALNTYPALTQEIWFTPVSGANTGYTMLSYFGTTTGGMGYNYVSMSAARGDDVSRTAISSGTYDSEIGANGTEFDDGKLHQMVSIINADSVMLYLDGKFIAKTKNTIALNTINTSLAMLGKGGYASDPTWMGSISKYSIYNKSLTASEVSYLFELGAEQSAIIEASKTALSFDEFYKQEIIHISGTNLADSIAITGPAGITIIPAKLAPNATNAAVTITCVSSTIDGDISCKSGITTLDVPVKSYTNECFSQVYPDAANLIPNPYMSSLQYFIGWGTRSINTDRAFVYCGATSGMVTGSDAGSLDANLTGKLKPKTDYRVKAQVFTIGGNFQIGLYGWSAGQPDFNRLVSTNSEWKDVDFTLTTGNEISTSAGIFFNNYGLSGTTGYIDNWEMYAIPKVYPSLPSLSFQTRGSKKIAIRAESLVQNISIISPNGFNVYPNTLSPSVNGDSITVEFIGDSSTDGYIYFRSGIYTDSMYVHGNIDPLITSSLPLVVLDEINHSISLTITGYNLNKIITLTSPAGITLSSNTLPENTTNANLTITYDGLGNSSGNLNLTSGSATLNVVIVADRNSSCFTPLYENATNLIIDPTCNSFTEDGSGNQGINTDPAYIYCGSRSGKINNGGSFNRDLTGLLNTNTTYRMRAMVYKVSEVTDQNMGHVTYTLAMDSASNPAHYNLIKEAMDSACFYYNKYTPFIENIYVYYNTGIPTAQANYHGSIGFGSNTRYMWVGTAIHEMAHYFGSGTSDAWHALMVNGIWKGTYANEFMNSLNGGVIHGDSQHYWPYGINQKEEITGLGSQEVQARALADAVKLIKAMLVDDSKLPTNNPRSGIGIYGWNAYSDDIYHEITVSNSWQPIDFTFTTGNTLKANQKIYFSEGNGFIDNWELYEVPGIQVEEHKATIKAFAYIQQNNMVLEIEQMKNTDISIGIYDIQGKLMLQTKIFCNGGTSKINLPVHLTEGLYLMRLSDGELWTSIKVINW